MSVLKEIGFHSDSDLDLELGEEDPSDDETTRVEREEGELSSDSDQAEEPRLRETTAIRSLEKKPICAKAPDDTEKVLRDMVLRSKEELLRKKALCQKEHIQRRTVQCNQDKVLQKMAYSRQHRQHRTHRSRKHRRF
jgi:hypothetical protein